MSLPVFSIRGVTPADVAAAAAIYRHDVESAVISRESAPVDPAGMARRLADVQATTQPWLVLVEDGEVLACACATNWRARPGYRHAVESSVCVAAARRGRGLGLAVYRALLAQLQGRFHCVTGGIALPNPASAALHEWLGFRQVACFSEVGHKFGQWVDVGYWQLLPEEA